jgi:hypothetical protein
MSVDEPTIIAPGRVQFVGSWKIDHPGEGTGDGDDFWVKIHAPHREQ